MAVLTRDNHFRFGYDGEAFNLRTSASDRWWVEYGRCRGAPLGFREECVRTAREIAEAADGPIWVLFSGGVDSEVAIHSFQMAGVPIQAAIGRFKQDYNIHDISYAVICCERMGIPYRFFELDLLRFWEREGMDYAVRTQCASPQFLPTMWLMDQVDGYPVLGSGECLLVKRVPSGYVPGVSPYPRSLWDLWEKEKVASWYRHLLLSGRNGCPGFFQYTPEIMLSYLLDDDVGLLVRDGKIGKLSTESSKLSIYRKYFDLLPRPKYSGYEKVMQHDAIVRAELEKRFPAGGEIFKTPYFELLERLAPLATGRAQPSKHEDQVRALDI